MNKLNPILLTVYIKLFILSVNFCFGQTISDKEIDSLNNLIETSFNDSIRGRAYNKLAFHYIFTDVNRAVPLLEKGLEDAYKYNLQFGKTELLNTKATYFDIIGQKDSAEVNFNKSLAISRKYKYRTSEVMTLNSLGLFHWKMGGLDKALSYFFQALQINEEYFPQHEDSRSDYLSNIGLIYQELKQYDKAIEYHTQSLRIRNQLQLTNGEAISYANLGVCHQNLKNYDKSEALFIKAIEKAEQAQNWWMYYSLYDNLGNIYNLTDRNEEAILTYKKSLNRPEDIMRSPKSDLSVLLNLASIYNKLKQPGIAIEYAENGLKLLETYPQLYFFSGGLHYAYAESNYMLGNIEKGSESMLKYSTVLDSVFSEQNAQALVEIKEKYESVKKDKMLLQQHDTIQQKELDIRKQTIWLISSVSFLLVLAGILYYLFKRKKAIAKQTALELKLTEEKKRTHIQEERLRISRELHDNIGSFLTLINASIEQIPEMSPRQIAENLPELQKILSLSMRELRKTVWLLNNKEITIDTLALRMRDFFKPFNQNGTKITVLTNGNAEYALTNIQATHLFRIIQEAVSNAHKHANAQNIQICLTVYESICFSVSDDGVGFEILSVFQGNGLQNMKSRMTELKGDVRITSEPNKGTTVSGCFLKC